MFRASLFLVLLWGGAWALGNAGSSPSPWLEKSLEAGALPHSSWELGTLHRFETSLSLLGEEKARLVAQRAIPKLPTLGPMRIAGFPLGFRFEGVRAWVRGLVFESRRGEWKGATLLLQGRVRVLREGRILLEGPSLLLPKDRDWISSKDLVVLSPGGEGRKKARLGLGLPSSALK